MDWLAGTRRRLLMVTVALACAIGAIVASDAHAQGYAVDFDCGRADGWYVSNTNENIAAWRDCGGAWLAGLKTLVVPHGDGRSGTGIASHSFSAPGGTRIVGLDWEGYKYHG